LSGRRPILEDALNQMLIRLENIQKTYQLGVQTVTALRDVDLIIEEGAFLAIAGPSGSWCEIWFVKSIATGNASSDSTIVLPIPQGTLLGVLRFPGNGSDRRGQSLKPGTYTLRYSLYPVDGAHQGVAPQRDFGLLTPISQDADPTAKPDYAKLVELSRTSGTPHPAVLSLETPSGTQFPALTKEGEQDVVLNVQVGNLKLAVIVVGKADS